MVHPFILRLVITMICKDCGKEITSEKIWLIHPKECIGQETKKSFGNISFQELKKTAKEAGINTYKMKQEDIIRALQRAGV